MVVDSRSIPIAMEYQVGSLPPYDWPIRVTQEAVLLELLHHVLQLWFHSRTRSNENLCLGLEEQQKSKIRTGNEECHFNTSTRLEMAKINASTSTDSLILVLFLGGLHFTSESSITLTSRYKISQQWWHHRQHHQPPTTSNSIRISSSSRNNNNNNNNNNNKNNDNGIMTQAVVGEGRRERCRQQERTDHLFNACDDLIDYPYYSPPSRNSSNSKY